MTPHFQIFLGCAILGALAIILFLDMRNRLGFDTTLKIFTLALSWAAAITAAVWFITSGLNQL